MPSSYDEGVLRDIARERKAQDAKWGFPQDHNYQTWVAILGEEFGEFAQEILRYTFGKNKEKHIEAMYAEVIQVAAVAAAIGEQIRRTYSLVPSEVLGDSVVLETKGGDAATF